MSSRFSEYLSNEKIDPRRLLVASRLLERLRPEDRQARLKHRLNRKSETPTDDKDKKEAAPKRRSGRPVTPRLLQQAQAGGTLSGSQKTRLLRALNHVLVQKKKDPAELRKVF